MHGVFVALHACCCSCIVNMVVAASFEVFAKKFSDERRACECLGSLFNVESTSEIVDVVTLQSGWFEMLHVWTRLIVAMNSFIDKSH